jgi:hypothetical protein
MALVFYIDYTPAILPAPDLFSVNDNGAIRAHHGEWNHYLMKGSSA